MANTVFQAIQLVDDSRNKVSPIVSTDTVYSENGEKLSAVLNSISSISEKYSTDNFAYNMFYPVGSIYISTSNISPEDWQWVKNMNPTTGTWKWERIQGRFLIGAGSATDTNNKQMSFNAGAVGGEYEHKLTIEEMPSHSHTYENNPYRENAGGSSHAAENELVETETGKTGGDQAHNNIPPYIAVYMWKRTA